MRTDKIRKYLIPNIPYLFILWAFLKLGTAYRLAAGNDFAHKLIGLGQTIGPAFADFAPGLAPLDWLVGIVGAVGFRLLIYFKSKNAKKFRRDAEYGSARWGTEKDIKPFVDPRFENNVILTGTEFLTMNTRPKIPANARNLNCCIIGSSGSGKTTSLYAFLNPINQPNRKIITVEDPVEYQLAGINQVQVNNLADMTFANALRAMLRQAPNIIMVGEIRDAETAVIAINAALTGHLVFSTLHTNDAPSAVTRMIDMGVKPFLVSSAVRAIQAQRLLRRVCKNCAEPTTPTKDEIRLLKLDDKFMDTAKLMKGRGCSVCGGTGYKGRVGIYEIFQVGENIQHLIYQKSSADVIREAARKAGMVTLREDGLRKAAAGITTLHEVLITTMGDAE
mgnify:CR=1 FL=1